MHHFKWGLQNWVVDALFKFPLHFENMAKIIWIWKNIEVDGHEKIRQYFRTKWLEPKYLPRQITTQIWAIIPRQKANQMYKSQKNQHLRKTTIQYSKHIMWFYRTETNHVCAANEMWEGGLGVPRQIMLLP